MTISNDLESCVFCKIARHESPASILYQDESVTVFNDIRPAASLHLLIIPNEHFSCLEELDEENFPVISRLYAVARLISERLNLADKGYRLILNNGSGAGQTVPHLHLHLLSGDKLPGFKHG